MQRDALLNQLGYTPNDALVKQLKEIENNTIGYEKIEKHILDLHDHLKVDNSYVAMSNSENYFKIKIEAPSAERTDEAIAKIEHFSEKFKVDIKRIEGKNTFYIVGFNQ